TRGRRAPRTWSASSCSEPGRSPTRSACPSQAPPSACWSRHSRCSPRQPASAPVARRTSSRACSAAGRSSPVRSRASAHDLRSYRPQTSRRTNNASGMTWQFVIAGALVGVLVGMTGMGGGSLMTPMLILLFGFNPKTAVGTDLLHGAVFKSFGAVRHRQLGNVHAHLALWMLVGSAPLSLVGVQIASSFSDGTSSAMSRVVGGALIAGGVGFAVKTFLRGKSDDAPLILNGRQKAIAVVIGATCGFVVGLTSVGSGTFFGLAMLLIYP